MLVEDHILITQSKYPVLHQEAGMEFYLLGSLANQDSNENFFNYVKKVSYFWWCFFSYFRGQNKCKIRFSVDYSVRTKKLLNTKAKTNINFSSKIYFLVKSRLKSRLNVHFLNLCVLQKGLLMQDCLSRLRVEVGEKTNAHWGSYNGNKHSKSFFTVSSGFNAYLEVFSGENKMQS